MEKSYQLMTLKSTKDMKKVSPSFGILSPKKNMTLVLQPVWVFEGPQGRVYLLSRFTLEAPLSRRHMINLYTFIPLS